MRVDHNFLKWIMNQTSANRSFARWRLRLSEYVIHIIYCAGVKHRAVDALSCLYMPWEDRTLLGDALPILATDITKNGDDISTVDAHCKEILFLNVESSPTDNTSPFREGMILEQENENYYGVAPRQVGVSNFKLTVDRKAFLIQNSAVNDTEHIFLLHLNGNLSCIFFTNLQSPDIRADSKCTIRSDTIGTGWTWPMKFIWLSGNTHI